VLRVARYGARAPVAESRLSYDVERVEVELASDASAGPYAGVHRMAAVEFLARLVDHIPGKGEVRTRYYRAYASRRPGCLRLTVEGLHLSPRLRARRHGRARLEREQSQL
jgi:hypothetical protein